MSETESDSDIESDSEEENPINSIMDIYSDSDSTLSREARSIPGYVISHSVVATAAKAENSDSDEYDTAEPDSVDPDPKLKFKADTPGKTAVSKPPRFDVPGLKPFEVIFCDEKDYSTTQRGGWTTSFILLDLASDAWFKVDENTKIAHGDSFQSIMIRNGVHLLLYPRTVYRDGCGSMKHV